MKRYLKYMLLIFIIFMMLISSVNQVYALDQTQSIYKYSVTQDENGNLKFLFYKDKDTLYDINTLFEIESLGSFTSDNNQSVFIGYTYLSDEEQLRNIRVKEEDKEYSEYTEVYIFSYQTGYKAKVITDLYELKLIFTEKFYSFEYVGNIQYILDDYENRFVSNLNEIKRIESEIEMERVFAGFGNYSNQIYKSLQLLNENNLQKHNIATYVEELITIIDSEVQVMIDDANLRLDENKDLEAAFNIYSETVISIGNYLTQKVSIVKEQVKDELTVYIDSNLNKDTSDIINKYVELVTSLNYNVMSELEVIKASAKTELDRYVLEIEINKEIINLDNYVKSLTTIIDLALYNIITDQNQLLYSAKDMTELNEYKTRAIKEIDDYLKTALDKAKEDFVSHFKDDNTSEELNEIIMNQSSKITTKNYNVISNIDELKIETSNLIYQYHLSIYKEEKIDEFTIYIDNMFYKYKVQEEVFINQLISKINNSLTYDDVDKELILSKEAIDQKLNTYYQAKLNELKLELVNYVSNYDINLNHLIDKELSKVDKLNHMDDIFIDQFLVETKEILNKELLVLLKEKYITELNEKLDTLSDLLFSKVDELKDEIEVSLESQIDLNALTTTYKNYKNLVDAFVLKDKRLVKFKADFETYKQSDKYTPGNLSKLNQIYEEGLTELIEILNENLESKITEIMAKLDKVDIFEVKNSSYNLFDKVTNPNYQMVIQNTLGIKKYSSIIYTHLDKVLLKDLSNTLKQNGYNDVNVLSGLNIEINSLTEFNGLYKVGIALPLDIINKKDLKVVYYEGETLEIIDTQTFNEWLVFDVEHFSHYYIVSLSKESKVIGYIIFILWLIICLEVSYLFYKQSKDSLVKIKSSSFLFIFITSAIGIPVIVMLLILITIFGLLILSMHKDQNFKVIIKKEIIQNEIYLDEFQEKDGMIYNYSFLARLIQAPHDSQKRYSDLKNYILSYKNITILKSYKYERYMHKNKTVLKLWIHGNHIKMYLNLDINKIDKERYIVEDVSGVKKHETTPVLYMIKGSRSLKYAQELVDLYFEGIEEKEPRSYKDYTKKYLDKKTLISRDLIRVKYTNIKKD